MLFLKVCNVDIIKVKLFFITLIIFIKCLVYKKKVKLAKYF